MKQEQLEQMSYSQYSAWLENLYMKIPKDIGFLTYDEAIKFAKKERILRDKEQKSLINKILGKLNLIPCNSKHTYEDYDLALTLMNFMNKKILTIEDMRVALKPDFYEEFFEKPLLYYHTFLFSYEDLDKLNRKEYKEFKQKEKELFQKAIPPYGNFNFVEIKYN